MKNMLEPKYRITNKILANIGQIEAGKEVIESAPLIPAFEKQFQTDAVVRTVHHGTHIEGNDLSLTETKKVLEGEYIIARTRDIQEVINYRNVVELLGELRHARGGYEPQMLKDIQAASVFKIVPEEKIGTFRTSQVVIKNEATGEVILTPPAYTEVPKLIDDFFAWLNSEESHDGHPVIKAGIAHYILVAIHPFIEGNGRTARAFASLVLMRENYDIKRFYALEEHFDQDPESYYHAFAEVDKLSPSIPERDLTVWLEYFTKVVAIELGKIKDAIKRISIDTRLRVKMGEQITLTEREMRLVEYLTVQGWGGMKELRSVLPMVSEDTILRDLKDLLEKGIIKKQGSTKAARYVIKN